MKLLPPANPENRRSRMSEKLELARFYCELGYWTRMDYLRTLEEYKKGCWADDTYNG